MGIAADVVRQACQAIWSEGQVERVAEFYSEDFRADYPMTDWGDGLEGVTALAKSVRIDLPDYTEHIEELIEADDEVVVRLNITGTQKDTGVKVSFRDVTMLTVRNGKICFQRGLTDYMTLYQQLGVISLPK